MKKLILPSVMFLAAISCAKGGIAIPQGEKNAAQYVKNINVGVKEATVIAVDTVFNCEMLAFDQAPLAKKQFEYFKGELARDEYVEFLEYYAKNYDEIHDSQHFRIYTDSLMKTDKYKYSKRVRYTVEAKYNDGRTTEERVLMERDGITPQCTQHDADKQMREYAIIIKRHLRELYGSY